MHACTCAHMPTCTRLNVHKLAHMQTCARMCARAQVLEAEADLEEAQAVRELRAKAWAAKRDAEALDLEVRVELLQMVVVVLLLLCVGMCGIVCVSVCSEWG